jgi:hypothetical protein
VLVDRNDHRSNHALYHPTGNGGRDIWGGGDDKIPLSLKNSYLVSDYPEVINDRDDYPADVKEKNLSLVYYGEQFIDVICSALEQKPSASEQELVEALIFYYQNDNFMTLKP